MKKISKKRQWIMRLRKNYVKPLVVEMSRRESYPGKIWGPWCCRCGTSEFTEWFPPELDEVDEGHHLCDGIPIELNFSKLQLLCSHCHSLKTNKGHTDYMAIVFPKLREKMKEVNAMVLARLPQLVGEMLHRQEDVDKSVKWVCRYYLKRIYR